MPRPKKSEMRRKVVNLKISLYRRIKALAKKENLYIVETIGRGISCLEANQAKEETKVNIDIKA